MPPESGDLFAHRSDFRPLAERLRPKNLDDFVGQAHILGADSALRGAAGLRQNHPGINAGG